MRDTGARDIEESFDVCVEHLVSIRIGDIVCRLVNPVYTGTKT